MIGMNPANPSSPEVRSTPSSPAKTVAPMPFVQRQRLQYIEAKLIWENRVQRRDVCEVFGVTENHLSREIRRYKDEHPGGIEYDPNLRAFKRGHRFRPVYASGSAQEYLTLLQAYAARADTALLPALGSVVPAHVVPATSGTVADDVLHELIRALNASTGLGVSYQSFSDKTPASRVIWPHALVFTGERWHARAYDDKRSEFRDFALTRILKAKSDLRESPVDASNDALWHETENIELVPAGFLSKSQKEVVAREYGMSKTDQGWAWRAPIRKCLIGYFLDRHRLSANDGNAGRRRVAVRPVTLVKRYSFRLD